MKIPNGTDAHCGFLSSQSQQTYMQYDHQSPHEQDLYRQDVKLHCCPAKRGVLSQFFYSNKGTFSQNKNKNKNKNQ
jgi:hypothetical protein